MLETAEPGSAEIESATFGNVSREPVRPGLVEKRSSIQRASWCSSFDARLSGAPEYGGRREANLLPRSHLGLSSTYFTVRLYHPTAYSRRSSMPIRVWPNRRMSLFCGLWTRRRCGGRCTFTGRCFCGFRLFCLAIRFLLTFCHDALLWKKVTVRQLRQQRKNI